MTLATPTAELEITETEVQAIDAWWRACNYLTIGQIYRINVYVGGARATVYQWALLKPTK